MFCVSHWIFLPLGKYHCPVTFKVFNENSHIVAIRTSGNVYSYEVLNGKLLRKTCTDAKK